MSIENRLALLNQQRLDLVSAVNSKGGSLSPDDMFPEIITGVQNLETGGGGSETIFTVTYFDYDETTVLKTQDVLQGGDVNPPANPSRDGYTFTGWSASSLNVQSDLTIVAQYAYSPNVVALLDYDLSLIELQNVAYGADIAAETPSKENMTFTGWSDSLLNVQGNRALIAKYDTNPTNYSIFELVLTPETGLTHTFYYTSANVNSVLYFGDGASSTLLYQVSRDSVEHTYPSYGTYFAKMVTPIGSESGCGWYTSDILGYQKGFLDGISAKAIINAYEGATSKFASHCFKNCINLQSVKLNNNKTSLYTRMFYNCNSLTGVVIPENVTATFGDSISQKIFEGCTSLERLVFLGPVPTFGSKTMSGIPISCIIYVPDEYISDYQSALSAYGYTIQGLSTLPNSYVV